MKKLLPYLKPYRKECVAAPLLKLLEALLDLLVPLVVAAIIDNGLEGQAGRGYILRMGLLLLGLGVFGFSLTIIAQYFAAKAATGFSAGLKSAVFRHVQSFSYSRLDEIGISTLINRLTTDMNRLQTGVNMGLRLLLRSPFVVFGAMVMACLVDAPTALIFAGVILLLFVVVIGLMCITLPGQKKIQGQLDSVLLQIRDNLNGVRVLRAFAKQEDETEAFRENHQALRKLQEKIGAFSALLNPLTYVLVNGALVMILYSGGVRVNEGALHTGQVVALVNYLSQILVELVKLANLVLTLMKAAASGDRVEKVLNEVGGEPAICDDTVSGQGEAVRFDRVSFCYDGASEPSLNDVSFSVFPGQTVGVIGSTGSGKTTLVNLIPRFYTATSGLVSVNGQDVKNQTVEALRAKIAVVPQKAELFRGSIRDNLLWGDRSASEEELWRALETSQAADFVREKGLDGDVEQSGRNFSGGQKQRLTIARALVRKAKILILDDSASALDYATDAALNAALRRLPEKPTVFFVSQRIASVRGTDLILVLEDGTLVGKGTHEELLSTCPVYRELYESQCPEEASRL